MLKAVILAGGNGIRMQPLTDTKPKPLLTALDRTIIERNLDQLDGLVKEVIIVIGYRGEMIRSLIGESYKRMRVRYVIQESQLGTGDAARRTAEFLDKEFIVLNGDDIYSKEDMGSCLGKKPCILLGEVEDPSSFGVVQCEKSTVKSLTEKPETFPEGTLVNAGAYFLDKSIFDFKIEKSPRGEYEFTDYIRGLLSKQKLYFKKAKNWIPVTYPWNLLEANEFLLGALKRKIEGEIEKNCFIHGSVKIEKGAVVKSGSYIEGPAYIKSGAIIGPNCFIRGRTVIGSGCRIGNGVEVKNSIIGDDTFASHLNYIGDSVIGSGCILGAGAVLANFRFDKKNIRVEVKGNFIDSGREKFGSVIGDNVLIGVNSSLMPGVAVGSGAIIGPHLMVKRNIGKNEKYLNVFDGKGN